MRKAIAICAVAAITSALGAAGAAPAEAVETTICETSHVSETCTDSYLPRIYEASGFTFIAAGLDQVTCSSTMKFRTRAVAGAPLPGDVLGYTLTGCEDNGVACPASIVLGAPFFLQITWTGNDRGSFEILPRGGGTGPQYKFSCAAIRCQYTANPVPLTLAGGSPAMLVGEFAVTRVGGGSLVCPTTAGVATELEVTSPVQLFVEHT